MFNYPILPILNLFLSTPFFLTTPTYSFPSCLFPDVKQPLNPTRECCKLAQWRPGSEPRPQK